MMAFPTAPDHEPGCPSPTPTKDDHGRLRCPWCRYLQVKPRTIALAATGYVCRDHHEQAVSWRGTGCVICVREAKKRKATKKSEPTEMETYR